MWFVGAWEESTHEEWIMRESKHINRKISLNGRSSIQRSSLTPSFGANLLCQDWKMLRSFFFRFLSTFCLPCLFCSELCLLWFTSTALLPWLDCIFKLCRSFFLTVFPTIPNLVCRHTPLTKNWKHLLNAGFYHSTQFIKIQISLWYE